jgi:hypothetical protein
MDCTILGIHPLGESAKGRKLPFSVFSVPSVVIELRFSGSFQQLFRHARRDFRGQSVLQAIQPYPFATTFGAACPAL